MIEVPGQFLPKRDAEPITEASEVISKVPAHLRAGIGGAANGAVQQELITRVPGYTGDGGYKSPEQTVADINAQLAQRDPSLGRPKISVGDIVVQRRG